MFFGDSFTYEEGLSDCMHGRPPKDLPPPSGRVRQQFIRFQIKRLTTLVKRSIINASQTLCVYTL